MDHMSFRCSDMRDRAPVKPAAQSPFLSFLVWLFAIVAWAGVFVALILAGRVISG